MKYGEKFRACLLMAAIRPTSIERARLYGEACARFSEKAICAKFEEMEQRGYIESGVTTRSGWLTDKGRAALAEIEAPDV